MPEQKFGSKNSITLLQFACQSRFWAVTNLQKQRLQILATNRTVPLEKIQ
jgi:hypothetical protein